MSLVFQKGCKQGCRMYLCSLQNANKHFIKTQYFALSILTRYDVPA